MTFCTKIGTSFSCFLAGVDPLKMGLTTSLKNGIMEKTERRINNMTILHFSCKLCGKSFKKEMPSGLPECYYDAVMNLIFFPHVIKYHLKSGKVFRQFVILLKTILKALGITIIAIPFFLVGVLCLPEWLIFEYLYNR